MGVNECNADKFASFPENVEMLKNTELQQPDPYRLIVGKFSSYPLIIVIATKIVHMSSCDARAVSKYIQVGGLQTLKLMNFELLHFS